MIASALNPALVAWLSETQAATRPEPAENTGLSGHDALIIELIRDQNPDGYRALLKRYKHKVMALISGYAHHQAEAEDIFQETFINAIRTIHSFKGHSSLGTWLYAIALNQCRQWSRKQQSRHWLSFRSPHEVPEPVASDNQPDGDEGDSTIRRAVDRLPEKQRMVVVLFYFNELSYQQTAEIMNTSVSAVESLLFRARKRLKRSLEA